MEPGSRWGKRDELVRGVSADTPSLLDEVTFGMAKSQGLSICVDCMLASFGAI